MKYPLKIEKNWDDVSLMFPSNECAIYFRIYASRDLSNCVNSKRKTQIYFNILYLPLLCFFASFIGILSGMVLMKILE